MRPLVQNMRRRFIGTALLMGALLCGASCGRPDTLVLVNVTGLEPEIKELRVTMTLDGVAARNGQPTPDDPDAMSFSIYKDMQRFGIDVPMGTSKLGVKVDGLNTYRVAVRTGSNMIDLAQQKDLDVMLR